MGSVTTSEDRPGPETIGQRLRRLRLERSLSQRALASPGVSYAYISRIEAGTRQPSVKAVRMLARKLGVSPVYLETGSEVDPAEERELRLAAAELVAAALRRPERSRADASRPRRRVDPGRRPRARRRAARRRSASSPSGTATSPAAIELLERALTRTDPSPSAQPDLYATLGRAYSVRGDAGQGRRALPRLPRAARPTRSRTTPSPTSASRPTSATRSPTRTTSRARRPRCAPPSRA